MSLIKLCKLFLYLQKFSENVCCWGGWNSRRIRVNLNESVTVFSQIWRRMSVTFAFLSHNKNWKVFIVVNFFVRSMMLFSDFFFQISGKRGLVPASFIEEVPHGAQNKKVSLVCLYCIAQQYSKLFLLFYPSATVLVMRCCLLSVSDCKQITQISVEIWVIPCGDLNQSSSCTDCFVNTH